MADDARRDDRAGRAVGNLGEREVLGAAEAAVLDQDFSGGAALAGEVRGIGRLALRAEAGGALLDRSAVDLRHTRRRRAGPRREGEDVEVSEPAVVDDRERILEHRLALGREAGDEVGAEDDFGPKLPHAL